MSKGSKRREEDSAKIANNWDKIFKSRWPVEEAVEDYKDILEDEKLKHICIMGENVLGYTFTSCPCVKCNPFTL